MSLISVPSYGKAEFGGEDFLFKAYKSFALACEAEAYLKINKLNHASSLLGPMWMELFQAYSRFLES